MATHSDDEGSDVSSPKELAERIAPITGSLLQLVSAARIAREQRSLPSVGSECAIELAVQLMFPDDTEGTVDVCNIDENKRS